MLAISVSRRYNVEHERRTEMPTPDPVAFSVFGIDIMWYGILVTCDNHTGTILRTHARQLKAFAIV